MRWRWSKSTKKEQPKIKNEQPTKVRCPLCGKPFQPDEAKACAACALALRCGLVMCPHCSYEFAL